MVKAIGGLLLVYGLAGVAGTLLIAWLLVRPQGLLQRLRQVLGELVAKLQWGVDKAQQAKALSHTGSQVLGDSRDKLGEVLVPLRATATFLGAAAAYIKGVEAPLNAVAVPTIGPPTFQTLEFNFGVNLLTGFALQEHDHSIAGVGFKTYGPEFVPLTTPFNVHVGPLPILSGFPINAVHPLAPIGQAFNYAGTKVEEAQAKVDETANFVAEVKDFVNDGKTVVDDLIKNVIDPLPEQIEEVRVQVASASASPLLTLAPLVVLGYFGLIHVAFALTGLALLFV